MSTRTILAAFLALLLAGPVAAAGKDFSGKTAPDFTIEEMSFGDEKSLSDFEGKVVLLNFWFLG